MPDSNFVFEAGEPINVGSHGETDYVYAAGEPVPNNGVSPLVFESGAGLGGGGEFVLSDGAGSASGSPGVIGRSGSVNDFYDHEPELYARGEVLDFAADHTASFMLHRNTTDGALSLVAIYDNRNGDGGGDVNTEISGLPGGVSFTVTDDTPASSDSYSMNPPDAATGHSWSDNRTDGWAISDLSGASGDTVTVDVTHSASVSDVRAIGSDGVVGPRSIGTDTVIEITIP